MKEERVLGKAREGVKGKAEIGNLYLFCKEEEVMKYIYSVCLVLLIVLGTMCFMASPSYHYKGDISFTISQANQLFQDKGGERSLEIFTGKPSVQVLSREQAKLYISYNFYGDKNDALQYGIPPGSFESKWDVELLILFCIAFVAFGLVQEYRNWGERKVSPSVKEDEK